MRPVTPSRRYRRTGPALRRCIANHRRYRQHRGRTNADAPADIDRRATCRASRQKCRLGAPVGNDKRLRTSSPTSKACGPIAGPSHTRISDGTTRIAATVASITPPSNPRASRHEPHQPQSPHGRTATAAGNRPSSPRKRRPCATDRPVRVRDTDNSRHVDNRRTVEPQIQPARLRGQDAPQTGPFASTVAGSSPT